MLSARIAQPCKLLLLLVFILAIGLPAPLPLRAQTGPVEVRTLSIDYSAFPDICLQVAPVAANGTVPAELSADSVQIYENGDPRPASTVTRGVRRQPDRHRVRRLRQL